MTDALAMHSVRLAMQASTYFSCRSGEREIFSGISERLPSNNDVCGGQQGRYMYNAAPLVNRRVGRVYQLNTSACNAVGYSDFKMSACTCDSRLGIGLFEWVVQLFLPYLARRD